MQCSSNIPSTITEVRQLNVMKQRSIRFLFLLYFSHKLVLTQHKRWVERLSKNDGLTKTLILNISTVKGGPFNQLSSRQAIV